MKKNELIRRIASCALIVFLQASGAVNGGAQNVDKAAPPQNASQPAPSSAALPPLHLDSDAILHHLNEVIGWYRQAATGIRDVGLPSDAIYQDNARALGSQAVELAFQCAKAESALIAASTNPGANQSAGQSSQQQALNQLKQRTSAQ